MRIVLTLLAIVLLQAGPGCAQSVPGDGEWMYVASARGEVYYWIECDNWRSLSPANLRWFTSAAEAEAAGYRPSQARGCSGPDGAVGEGPIERGVCTIERVVDGDTVVCTEAAERVRLLLIDAPELAQGEYGRQAQAALARLIPPGSVASIELDLQERDRYGRILAYLYTADGEMVNEVLARQGYAVPSVIPPNVREVERIRAASEDARRARRGLWSGSAFECAPADYRAGRCE